MPISRRLFQKQNLQLRLADAQVRPSTLALDRAQRSARIKIMTEYVGR